MNTYNNDTANWLLGRLLRAQVTSNGPTGALTRKSAFGYHGVAGVACTGGVAGVLCSETIEPDEETKPIASLENGQPLALLWQRTAYTYDQYGNRVSTTVSYKDRAADAAGYNVALVDKSRKSSTCFDTNANAPASDCFEASGARQSYGRFPLLVRNAMGHSEARTFDSRLGVPLGVRGPNGMLTTSSYDGFGRKFLETVTDAAGNRLNQTWSPLEGVNAVARCAASTAPNCLRTFEQYRTRTLQSGGAASHVYYDILQRELRRESKAFASGTWADAGADYDALGRRQNLKRPAANGVVTTTLGYDTIGRVVKEAPDAGGVVCTRYNGLSVTTTRHPDPGLDCQTGTGGANPLGTPINATSAPAARNQAATRTQNGRGQLAQVSDSAGGVTTYRYDAHDNLLQVTPLASSTLSEALAYDRRGRKLALISPDSGNWTYEYNGAGELVRQTDGKGQVTRHHYDSLGRMIERREHPGSESTLPFVTVWTHDAHAGDAPGAGACNKALGKLCEVRSNSVNRGGVTPGSLLPLTHGGVTLPVQRRTFHDDQGRVLQAVSTLLEPGGSRSYASRSAFDANGRVDTLAYPSGYAVRHRYAAWTGQLDQVSETAGAVVHWQASSRYKDGQIATMLVGGATTTRNYDAFGRLAGIATSAAGAAIQGASSGFDLIGNLTRRYDPAAGQADQYYGYDVLNRLTAAAPTAAGIASAANAIAQYDATGNLTWKSGTGYYGYVPGTHRLCAIGAAASPACAGSQYQHDGNGNATLWSGRSLAYTPFNSPAQIVDTANGATLAYQHDAGHARIKEVSSVNGLTYYLGAYEEHTRQADSVLEQRHYVHTPEGIAGVVTLRSAPTGLPALPPEQAKSLRYWHKDHLGSVVAITGEAGALKQTFTYDPWGQRTNPGLATGEPYAEERGYTGHEHLAEVRLIHMNGRVFDPAAGRFLQADPVVQEATNSQNYNRYAYVLNNPLSLTDPSGHSWLSGFIHKSTAQMQFLHGDLAGGWLTRKYADRVAANPYVRMVGAAVAAFYTYDFVSAWAAGAGYSVAAANAIGGSAAGFASGGIQGGNVESAVWGAVMGAIGGYISGGTLFGNPIEQASSILGEIAAGNLSDLGQRLMYLGYQQAVAYAEAELLGRYKIDPRLFDTALMALSMLGNEGLTTKTIDDDGTPQQVADGVPTGSRYVTNRVLGSASADRIIVGFGNRGFAGLPFDTVDLVLEAKGMPSATVGDWMRSGSMGLSVTGHSLGGVTVAYLVGNGLASRGYVFAPGAGSSQPPRVLTTMSAGDVVSLFWIGRLTNPSGRMCTLPLLTHAMIAYDRECR
ncbi:MAG: RHS repeat-associated core domain-containing protein [Betaproteobacteria bacterium]|nr:RHS repeat-associated core domain-containing protein [Betaproteobacteria bacterium]